MASFSLCRLVVLPALSRGVSAAYGMAMSIGAATA